MVLGELVSIVIVNFNSGLWLRRCLDSITKQDYPYWEIIIVDNASSDDSLETIEGLSGIRVVLNEKNLGFAAAQNIGMHMAKGAYLMPLNFDVEMRATYLGELVRAIEISSNFGTATGKLMQMRPAGEHLDIIYSTGHVLPPNRFAHHRGNGERDLGQYNYVCEVFGAPGAAPLYRRNMLEDLEYRDQYFDESFFMWYEDVDLDWRARSLGWKCVYTPKAIAYHVGHPEGHAGNLWQIRLNIRNRWLSILVNGSAQLFSRTSWAKIKYELGLFRYVLWGGFAQAYFQAIRDFVDLVPAALAKRRWIQTKMRHRLNGKGQDISGGRNWRIGTQANVDRG